MKLKELIEGVQSLKIISEEKLPIAVSFKVSLFISKINPAIDAYNKERNGLIKELSTPEKDNKGKETGNVKFKGEKELKEFNEKIDKLLEEDVKVEIPEIKIDDFKDVSIEPKHLVNLTWLIKA